jgi:hypothetical protein
MSEEELAALVIDIKANGLREPITRQEITGLIIDGRNRWRACKLAGVVCTHKTYGKTDDTIHSWVISKNLHRRHLDTGQRALVAARISKLPAHRPSEDDKPASLRTSEAASLLNVGTRSVESGHVVLNEGVPELITAVEQGQVSVSAAAEIAKAPVEEQREIVAKGPEEVAKEANRIKRETKAAGRTSGAKKVVDEEVLAMIKGTSFENRYYLSDLKKLDPADQVNKVKKDLKNKRDRDRRDERAGQKAEQDRRDKDRAATEAVEFLETRLGAEGMAALREIVGRAGYNQFYGALIYSRKTET